MQECVVPHIWKCTNIVSLPKTTPPKTIEQDLRSISLTPVSASLMEDYPVKWMWDVLDGKIDKNQFACLKTFQQSMLGTRIGCFS